MKISPDEPVLTPIHVFARARDICQAGAVWIDARHFPMSVADLRRRLAEQVPALAPLLERSAIAVNHDFADDTQTLTAGDEVAVIPPVSGG